MNELSIIRRNGGAYIDSREVAEMIGKRHDNLLRDIAKYRDTLASGGLLKIEESDFFLESSYINAQNKPMPCYLISKMGCELVANKLTGEKGILFTATYVARFNEMEQRDSAKLVSLSKLPVPRWYRAGEIAQECGLYSLYGNPHAWAVACIISENLCLHHEHRRVVQDSYNGYTGTTVLYDGFAMEAVEDWLEENAWPLEVYGFDRTFHVQYPFRASPQLTLL